MDRKDIKSENMEFLLYQKHRETLSNEEACKLEKLLADSADNGFAADLVQAVLSELSDKKNDAPAPTDQLVSKTLEAVADLRQQEKNLTLVELQSQAPVSRATFSLKELIAIAACLLLAIGILFPAFNKAAQAANRSKCAAFQGQIGSALQSFALNNNGLFPSSNQKKFNWLTHSNDRLLKPVSNSRNLYKLIAEKYVPNPQVFLCPAVGGVTFNPEQNQADFKKSTHVNFSYAFNSADSPIRFSNSKNSDKRIVLADSSPIVFNGSSADLNNNIVSANHNFDGQNVLFLDGHTKWQAASSLQTNDNIFQAGQIENYVGTEKPENDSDTFLLPAWTDNALLSDK